ncbi:MAG: alpha/beta fold hydrolase [Actinomycetia bacterium]|nr:alpha/beta fold hydrolase [Actinomycetes bacterium]
MSGVGLAVYRVGGSPPKAVFLHGLLGQGRNWFTIAKGLQPAGSLLVDLPYHGRSGRQGPITYPALAAQVAEMLRLGGAAQHPVTLVGHSMGGKVAMQTALAHPELVARLCVVDMAPAVADPSGFRPYLDTMLGIDLEHLPSRAEADQALLEVAPDPAVRGFLLQNLRRSGQDWYWAADLAGLRQALPAIGDWQPPDTAPFTGPVLWVAGAQSGYIRPEHLPAMRALFPRVRLVTVKSAGHWVHADQPEVMTDLLRQLLEAS